MTSSIFRKTSKSIVSLILTAPINNQYDRKQQYIIKLKIHDTLNDKIRK